MQCLSQIVFKEGIFGSSSEKNSQDEHFLMVLHFKVREDDIFIVGRNSRVRKSSGNHGKPGKSLKKVPCMEKSWNLEKPEYSWKNHGIL